MNDAPKTAAVITEILAGEGIGMGAAARLLPSFRGEGRACPSTIWRWISKGHRLPCGEVFHLEAARVAGRWLTSRAAIARFMTVLTDAALPDPPSPPRVKQSEAARLARARAAGERLKAMGC